MLYYSMGIEILIKTQKEGAVEDKFKFREIRVGDLNEDKKAKLDDWFWQASYTLVVGIVFLFLGFIFPRPVDSIGFLFAWVMSGVFFGYSIFFSILYRRKIQ